MIEAFKRLLAPFHRRIMGMIARVEFSGTKEDRALQRGQLKLLADETRDDVEMVGHYGFISRPKDGAEGVAVFLGGERSHGVIIATEDRRYRIKTLQKGEVALYTDEGDYIHLKRNRNIEVVAGTKVKVTSPLVEVIASTKVTLTTPLVEMSGNLTVAGNTTISGNTSVGGTSTLTGAVSAGATIVAATSVSAPTIAATGPGGVSDTTGTMSSLRTKYNAHKHSETGTTTGTTDQPA